MSTNDIPELYFIFPYRGVGGVSMLFLRIAECLAENHLAKAWLVDYPDGFMAKHRREGLAQLLPYEDSAKVEIPAKAIAIFQSMTPWSIYPSLRLAKQTRVLFWNCHPFNLVPTLPGFRQSMQSHLWLGRFVLNSLLLSYKRKTVRLIHLLLRHRSLVFMDSTNLRSTERYLAINIDTPVYLPIAVSPPAIGTVSNVATKDFHLSGVRVAWVGRLVDFKYYVLKRALIELNRLQPVQNVPIDVVVVGSGEFNRNLKQDVQLLKRITVRFIEHIAPVELDRFLIDHVDLLLAMGTCALDGAKLGIPTLLLDCSYKEVPAGYLFQWLHSREGYTLGDLIGSEHIRVGSDSMAERLDEFLANRSELSVGARSYVEINHELSKIAQCLISIVRVSSCTWKDFEDAGILDRGFVYLIFDGIRKRLLAT